MKLQGLEIIFTPESFSVDNFNQQYLNHSDAVLKEKFHRNKFQTLYNLAFETETNSDSPTFNFLRQVSETFLEILTSSPDLEVARENFIFNADEFAKMRLLNSVPFAVGVEYVDNDWLTKIFNALAEIFRAEILNYKGSVAEYFSSKRNDLKIPEKIFFHLVESKDIANYPFAFLATYATKDANNKVRHVSLINALQEFKDDRQKLLKLLSCLNKAAEVSNLISNFVESGEMFHPLRLTANEAYEILKSIPALEERGIVCRIPNWWKHRKASKFQISVSFGSVGKSLVGFNSLISMQPKITVDGVELTNEDIQKLLLETAGFAQIKGKWVEVDKARLQELLNKIEEYGGNISFLDALKIESGFDEKSAEDDEVNFTNGEWLNKLLQQLRRPEIISATKIPATVHAQLRNYQQKGYAWLKLMENFNLGACLADDMGLGKTLQVLTFLEDLRINKKISKILLIVPASLLGNWEKEISKFTPEMDFTILHGKTKTTLESEINNLPFLTITTYTMATKLEELQKIFWDCVILDEAQAIKNSATKQTKAIKKLPAIFRIALTGTPIENNLANLWSLFDFLNKGLLGTAQEFKNFSKSLEQTPENYQKLRRILSPFILRRLKTDKKIISDLPEKIEQIDYTNLSKKQIVLYRKQIVDLENKIRNSEGIARRGIILATITKLKQICNHPDQFLGLENYNPAESGKFDLLKEICETICAKREKVLIFTQYREITNYLADYLSKIFNREGLIIHGGTNVKKRTEFVELFNSETYIPFMILSVKAAGVGLNLTAASHVIHFDRWWNPAVENQATDRAYRIGQNKNVVVHKFVAKGTIEEKIDEIINRKKMLAENVIGSGEKWITELTDEEIISMMKLEI